MSSLEGEAKLSGSTLARLYAIQWRVFLAQLRGDWDEAERLSTRALDPIAGLGPDFAGAIGVQSLVTSAARGESEVAERMFRSGMKVSSRPILERNLFALVALDGRHDAARQILERLDFSLIDADQLGGNFILSLCTEALAEMGDLSHLPALVERLFPVEHKLVIGTAGMTGLASHGPFRYFVALGLVALGRFDEAQDRIDAERPRCESLGAKPYLLQLDYAQAKLTLHQDGLAAARAALNQLQENAIALGMKGLAARAESCLSGP